MKHFDAIIIGAGQAGVPLAKKLAEAGKKTALIEKRLVGGTCINDGCTPTKSMVASAKAAFQARKAGDLGIEIKEVKVNLKAIKKRKDKIVKSFRDSSQKGLEETKGLELIFGEAVFTASKTLKIKLRSGGEQILSADQVFINTGAKTNIPDMEGLEEIDFLTSTSILDLDEVPEHLLVIGGNYIGLEFGQMFSRFGSKVTIIEKSGRLLSKEDEDVAEEVTRILEDEKITIITNAEVDHFTSRAKEDIYVHLKVKEKPKKLHCSHVLIAIGRSPQTEALSLDATGVMVDEKGAIVVDDKLETNVPGIYALGDVKGGPAFTHIAYNDYTIVYRNLIEKTNYNIKDRPLPYCMFTDPQLGRVGLSENEARKKGLNIKIAVLPMSYVARGIETGETKGMMKAVVDADTKEILGATILGAEGGEIAAVLEMAMEGGITYDRLRYCVFAHPTYAESINNLFMKITD